MRDASFWIARRLKKARCIAFHPRIIASTFYIVDRTYRARVKDETSWNIATSFSPTVSVPFLSSFYTYFSVFIQFLTPSSVIRFHARLKIVVYHVQSLHSRFFSFRFLLLFALRCELQNQFSAKSCSSFVQLYHCERSYVQEQRSTRWYQSS